MKIPITKPFIGDEEIRAVSEVIKSGWITQGPKIKEFEDLMGNYLKSNCVAVNSCTTALDLALKNIDLKPGDEVIVPSLSFIASANCILYNNAIPRFVESDPRTFNIDADEIEPLINEKTKAIVPVHQVGLPADLDRIYSLAKKHNLHVVEDAACALGSQYKGKLIGSFGEISCFSLHPRKVITTGEGGLIVTKDNKIADRMRCLRSHGATLSDLDRHKSTEVVFEEYEELGYNYRITDMQAAMGIEQFKKLEYILKKRKELAEIYNEELGKIDGIYIQSIPSYATPNHQTYAVRIKKNSAELRNRIMNKMLEKGIATRRMQAVHLEKYYIRRFGKISLPKTEEANHTMIILPFYPSMSDDEQRYVIQNLKEIVRDAQN
jgi:perosamine synthetase